VNTHGLKILITGGGSGIGLALARRLAAHNDVVIAGRTETKLNAAVLETPSLRSRVLDVADEDAAQRVVDEVAQELGGLSLLINAAGTIEGYGVAEPGSAERAEHDIAINFVGSLRMARLSLPYLRQVQDGAIVFISSVVAIAPAPGYPVYSAAKAAVHSLARSMRRDLAGTVGVFDVLPTWVDTEPARGLHVPKLSPNAVAEEVVRAMEKNRYEVFIGRSRLVALINGIRPRMAEDLVARATRPG